MVTAERARRDGKPVFAAVSLGHGDVQVSVEVSQRHVIQAERPGGNQRGVNKLSALADIHAGLRSTGNTADFDACPRLGSQCGIRHHLHPVNTRNTEAAVGDVNLAALHHHAIIGKGTLGIRVERVDVKILIAAVANELRAAHNPVSGVKAHFKGGLETIGIVIIVSIMGAEHGVIQHSRTSAAHLCELAAIIRIQRFRRNDNRYFTCVRRCLNRRPGPVLMNLRAGASFRLFNQARVFQKLFIDTRRSFFIKLHGHNIALLTIKIHSHIMVARGKTGSEGIVIRNGRIKSVIF